MKRVRIHVKPNPYDAIIQSGLLSRAGESLAEITGAAGATRRCFIITVPNVRKHWENGLTSSLKSAGFDATILEMRDGERYKTMAAVEDLAARLIKLGADRTSILIALG